MGDWAVYAETDDSADDDDSLDAADVDDSLEARRLSRWLKAMFGGAESPRPPTDDERGDTPH